MVELGYQFIYILIFECYRDGRLYESDQILCIDGQLLDSAITHQEAIGILQKTRGNVELIVARGSAPRPDNISRTTSGASSAISRTPSNLSSISRTSDHDTVPQEPVEVCTHCDSHLYFMN